MQATLLDSQAAMIELEAKDTKGFGVPGGPRAADVCWLGSLVGEGAEVALLTGEACVWP